jgi:hypothetical protein
MEKAESVMIRDFKEKVFSLRIELYERVAKREREVIAVCLTQTWFQNEVDSECVKNKIPVLSAKHVYPAYVFQVGMALGYIEGMVEERRIRKRKADTLEQTTNPEPDSNLNSNPKFSLNPNPNVSPNRVDQFFSYLKEGSELSEGDLSLDSSSFNSSMDDNEIEALLDQIPNGICNHKDNHTTSTTRLSYSP